MPDVVDRDPAVDLLQRSLDEVLELGRDQRPDPLRAMRCPQASGANRPRSCGPSTLNVIMSPEGASCPLSTIAARHRHKITANRIQSRNILKTKDLPRSFQCHFGKLVRLSRQGKTGDRGYKLL